MINNKQKAYLKSLANQMKPLFQVGKDGITENLIRTIQDSLEAHELMKLNVLKSCELTIQEVAIELARETHSEIVQTMGRVITLYRKNREKNNGIVLPK